MHDVFISYSSLDKPVADAVVHCLEERSVRCWYAPRDIKAGEKWEERIMDAILQAKIFVLIYSKRSNVSGQVMNEVSNACAAGCVIIPFRLDQSQMSKGLSYYLHSVHWLDATDDDLQANAEKLCITVKAILSGNQPPPPPTPDPPTPPTPPTPPKPKSVWKRILIAVLVLALAAGGFFLVKEAPQDAYLFCISHIGTLSYPGWGDMMLSGEYEQIVLQDRDSEQLVSVEVENPYQIIWEAEGLLDNPLDTRVIQTDSNPYVYFLDNLTKEYRIFSRKQYDWITDKEQISGLKETEAVYSYCYHNPHILAESTQAESVVIFFYDFDPEVDCISKLATLSSEGILSIVDISHLNLINLICVNESFENRGQVLMMDKESHPVLIDISNGNVISADMHTIYETYLPNAVGDPSVISPNKRYVICRDTTYDVFGDRLSVWDMKTGNRVFSHRENSLCDIYFSGDNSLIYYDHVKNALFSLNLEANSQSVFIMQESDFEHSKDFLDIVTKFYYSSEHDACFFVSVEPASVRDGSYFAVTVTDRDGKVLAKSEKIYIENWNVSPVLWVTKEAVILIITSKNEEFATDEEYTAIYRALYTVDTDGNLRFKDSY